MSASAPLSVPSVTVCGPYFDELSVGQVFDESPSVTLTDGRQAAHQAIVGNRLRLSLDDTLAAEVTGQRRPGLPIARLGHVDRTVDIGDAARQGQFVLPWALLPPIPRHR